MSALSGSAAVSVLNKDPLKLPRYLIPNALLAINTSTTAYTDKTLVAFGTHVDYIGAFIDVAANTDFQTIVDISGAGFLCNVGGATKTTLSSTEIRITADGVETTIELTSAANESPVIGAMVHSDSGNVTTHSFLNNALLNYSAAQWANGQQYIANRYCVVPTLQHVMDRLLPTVRFETSLKVEVRSSTGAFTTSVYQKRAWCTYALD